MGAGTCQLSNYLAIGTNNKIYAMDTTMESLKLGKQFSDKNYIKNITYIKLILFSLIKLWLVLFKKNGHVAPK